MDPASFLIGTVVGIVLTISGLWAIISWGLSCGEIAEQDDFAERQVAWDGMSGNHVRSDKL